MITVATLALLTIPFPTGADAQPLASSFEELQNVLKIGDAVVVTDLTGHRVRAKIEQLTPSALTVIEQGHRRALSESDVLVVERDRHLRKKVAIGMGVGAALGVAMAGALAKDCQNECELMPVWMGGLAALGAGAGSAIGWGVGVAAGPPTVYRRVPQSSAVLSPRRSSHTAALFVSLKF
jgi:hypothetical protein